MEIKRLTISASVFRTIRGFIYRDEPRRVDIIKRPRIMSKIRKATASFLNKTRHRNDINPTLNK